MLKNISTIIVVAIIFLLVGVGHLIASNLTSAPGTADNHNRPTPIHLVTGWDDDEMVQCWDFGPIQM